MADIRDCMRSLLPGRARLRHPMLYGLDAESCREVAGMLETIPGVTGVAINPRVGSLLITWNEVETTAETLLETVEGYAAFFFAAGGEEEAGALEPSGESPQAVAPGDEKETSCTACRAVERAAETAESVLGRIESAGVGAFGAAARTLMPEPSRSNPKRAARILQNRTMLGALVLSIGVLGVKQTGLHLWAGVAFMALLALHLQQHRRVL